MVVGIRSEAVEAVVTVGARVGLEAAPRGGLAQVSECSGVVHHEASMCYCMLWCSTS